MPDMVRKEISATFEKKENRYWIYASTKDLDRDNEIILPSAFNNLNEYLSKNPVILFAHDRWTPPIGKATNGRITDTALEVEIEFADTELGREIRYLYENGFMHAFSVGFIPKKYDIDKEGRKVYTDVELLEISAVPVPANSAAVMIREAKSKGVSLEELERLYVPDSPGARNGDKADETAKPVKRSKVLYTIDITEVKNMSKIELLKQLIAKTEDEEELKRLNDELLEAIREEEREKIRKELETKQAQDVEKQMKEKAKAIDGMATKIEVGTPGNYKGYSLKYAMHTARQKFAESPMLKNALKVVDANPEGFEKTVKLFIDMYDDAIKNPVTKAPLAEGTGSAGGYLVPTEERMELLSYIREASIAMRDCTHVQMTTDVMTLPRELTKVSVAFTDEGDAATETTPSFDQVTLTAKRLNAYTISSNELIQDTKLPGGIAGVLLSQFVEAIGQKIDSAVFIGTGSPVSGVFQSAGYSQVFGSGSTNFSALLEADLRAIISKIPSSRLANAKFYIHRSPLWTVVYGLKDTQNRLLFIPSMTQSAPHSLLGYPVEQPEMAPAVSAAGTGFIVFGDLRGFWIGDRLTNISLFIDPYSRSVNYQTVFLMFTRWAFAHALPEYYGRIVTAGS